LLNAQVLITWFGEYPEVPKGIPQQIFSVAMTITGLAAFAIVLALVEQLVLQILNDNVSRGSQVYEKGHILVLAWATTQRDREVIWKILSQAKLNSRRQPSAVCSSSQGNPCRYPLRKVKVCRQLLCIDSSTQSELPDCVVARGAFCLDLLRLCNPFCLSTGVCAKLWYA